MTYREPPSPVELPPAGVTTSRSQVSEGLRARLDRLAEEHASGRTERTGEGQGETVTFGDDTVWFPGGQEKDNKWIWGAVAFGALTLAFGALALTSIGESPYPYWQPGAAFVVALVGRWFFKRTMRVRDGAFAQLRMGTLAMGDALALLSYDEIVVFPRKSITGFEIAVDRGGDHDTYRVHVTFETDDGEAASRYVGFVWGSQVQREEALEAKARLQQWLDDEHDVAVAAA